MKTRIIYTKFWHDNYISELNIKEKLVFIYLVTNEKVNICGIYELPDKYIKFDLGLKQSELDRIKQKFQKDGKFTFIYGWIKITNFEIYNKFDGEKNKIAKQKEMALIPKKIIERIFEPYYTTKEQGKGTGMGLYMSKMIIEDNMGGRLEVFNEDNGAIFKVTV